MADQIMRRSYTQKEWTELIEQILLYLSENNPDPSLLLYKTERQALPSFFLNNPLSHYCYPFKGLFLPSGNLDGIVWKPSQGAKPAGKNLLKRYFYYKKDNFKINRQVIWLNTNENWCFLDYRYNFKGKIKLIDIQIPEDFNFSNLIMSALSPELQTNIVKKKPKVNSDQVGPLTVKPNPQNEILLKAPIQYVDQETFNSQSLVNQIRAPSNVYPVLVPKLEENFISSFEENEITKEFLNEEFQIDTEFSTNILNLEDSYFSSKDEEESYDINRKRGRVSSPEPNLNVSGPSSFLIPLSSPLSLTSWDWQWANPSTIFNSGLEYFFDMVSHLICKQLMFQRRFFKKYSIDGEVTLESVRQVCVTVDLQEFPGRIFKSFFEYISENYFYTRPDQLPTIYCLVCGHDIKSHDEKVHKEFFGHLDQSLVNCLQEKAKNMYELVKQYIIFLLKNPNSHERLRTFLFENLHCPFCSGTNGFHLIENHKKWANIWKVDPPIVPVPPVPTNNVYDYTKTTFEWLVDQVPFYIPPFLLSLHYAKYVRTFMECLVTCWNTVRLFA
jgi:hypothetical protein